jgi:hypothetical protein
VKFTTPLVQSDSDDQLEDDQSDSD